MTRLNGGCAGDTMKFSDRDESDVFRVSTSTRSMIFMIVVFEEHLFIDLKLI